MVWPSRLCPLLPILNAPPATLSPILMQLPADWADAGMRFCTLPVREWPISGVLEPTASFSIFEWWEGPGAGGGLECRILGHDSSALERLHGRVQSQLHSLASV
eukprot:s6747_g3.t1